MTKHADDRADDVNEGGNNEGTEESEGMAVAPEPTDTAFSRSITRAADKGFGAPKKEAPPPRPAINTYPRYGYRGGSLYDGDLNMDYFGSRRHHLPTDYSRPIRTLAPGLARPTGGRPTYNDLYHEGEASDERPETVGFGSARDPNREDRFPRGRYQTGRATIRKYVDVGYLVRARNPSDPGQGMEMEARTRQQLVEEVVRNACESLDALKVVVQPGEVEYLRAAVEDLLTSDTIQYNAVRQGLGLVPLYWDDDYE